MPRVIQKLSTELCTVLYLSLICTVVDPLALNHYSTSRPIFVVSIYILVRGYGRKGIGRTLRCTKQKAPGGALFVWVVSIATYLVLRVT